MKINVDTNVIRECILDVLSPYETNYGITKRDAIFKWSDESIPTDVEIDSLVNEIVESIKKVSK
jgi:hypothetical protein